MPVPQAQCLEFFIAKSAIFSNRPDHVQERSMAPRALQETAVRYFLEVVKTGSVKEAALKLNVAPKDQRRTLRSQEAEASVDPSGATASATTGPA